MICSDLVHRHISINTGKSAVSASPAIRRYRYFFFTAIYVPFLTYQTK